MADDATRSAAAVVTQRVFWCGIASRAHLVHGAAWIRRLTGPVQVTVFPTRAFLGAPALRLDDVRAFLPKHVAVDAWGDNPVVRGAERPSLLSVGAVGLKPWLALRRSIGVRHLPVVVTDEGLGSYGNWFSRRQAWAREGVSEPWLSTRTTAVTVATRVLSTRRWSLYRQDGAVWSLNEDIADEFRRHATRSDSRGGAVFLSQPWPELGVMSESRYLDHVASLAAETKDLGFGFTVHPHPAEPPTRYAAWGTHSSRGLAELDTQATDASVLLGASSTGMLNVAAIHGVPAMRVGTPELEQLDSRLTPRQESLLTHYVGRPVHQTDWRSRLSALRDAPGRPPGGRS